jgi:hypothetical protein
VIDGRPLLSILNGADVVSALATDLETEVGCLLLRTPSRLSSGRHLRYCCPECGRSWLRSHAGRDHPARQAEFGDFGWQDGDDQEVDGLGPFRFSASEYRNALQQVLSDRGVDRWPVARNVAGRRSRRRGRAGRPHRRPARPGPRRRAVLVGLCAAGSRCCRAGAVSPRRRTCEESGVAWVWPTKRDPSNRVVLPRRR